MTRQPARPVRLPPEELITAVRVAERGDALVDPSVTPDWWLRLAASLAPPENHTATTELEALTPRGHAVFALIAAGHDNTEIAHQLYIGDETVKTHAMTVPAVLPSTSARRTS